MNNDIINEIECPHYNLKCNIITECCNKEYRCKSCHNQSENHKLIIKEIKCLICNTIQPPSNNCISCKIKFAKSYCNKCLLWTNKYDIFHCDKCKCCRVGKKDENYHCDKCNLCLPIKIKNNHVCIENNHNSECPICLEKIGESKKKLKKLMCGHILHYDCLIELNNNLFYKSLKCPICQKSL